MLETWLPELRVLGQCLVALILGGVIGWERERAGKWAGFRTHMLVCVSAMLFVRIGIFLLAEFQTGHGDFLRADPLRVLEAIVTGIAFIGAGAVFRDRDRRSLHGLTTAATLLAVAPIGVAVAIDRYVLATGATLLVFFILRVLGHLEKTALAGRTPGESAASQPQS